MSNREDPPEAGGGSSGRFDFLQPRRDLLSNWEVDLAQNLEDYLLKICSGELASDQSVNFAEAALLLQGSVQVYSRKVEYLYSLVLHVLEFLSQKSRKDQEKDSTKPDDDAHYTATHEEDDVFLGLDDVPVEAKNCRDDDKIEISNHFIKAPTNLLVLEGDCLDTSGETNELDSYLLAASDFYGDFLLLDPCDAQGIDSFLQKNAFNHEQASTFKGTSGHPKTNENVSQTPIGRSGGSIKASLRKNHKFIAIETLEDGHTFEKDSVNEFSEPGSEQNHPEDMYNAEEAHFGSADAQDDPDEDEDPWKPLNPHEPGNLKVKPFKKGRNLRKQINPICKKKNQFSQFPLAKMNGIISPELAESIEVKVRLKETQNVSQSPAIYEKLRCSLSIGGHGSYDFFDGLGAEDNQDTGVENDLPDFDQDDYDMGMEPPSYGEKESDGATKDGAEFSSLDDLDCSQNLEDLCRSHLDGLLATIAETEKKTQLATRVSTWKQRIEQTLKEQDKHSVFDIHQYGERILDKLPSEDDDNGSMTFTDAVIGQPKHEVARTFSALLQLVNNGNVDLQRPQSSDELVCYTAKNPFRIELLRSERRKVRIQIPSTKKRLPSPLHKGNEAASPLKPAHTNDRVSVKLKKGGLIRHTPEGKRRRRSGFAKIQHSAADV